MMFARTNKNKALAWNGLKQPNNQKRGNEKWSQYDITRASIKV